MGAQPNQPVQGDLSLPSALTSLIEEAKAHGARSIDIPSLEQLLLRERRRTTENR